MVEVVTLAEVGEAVAPPEEEGVGARGQKTEAESKME